MRRRIAFFVAFVVVPATSLVSLGQECRAPALFSKCGAMRLELALGRITLIPVHRGSQRVNRTPEENHGVRESLVVNQDALAPLVRYESSDEHQSLTVEILNFTQVSLICEQLAGSSPRRVEFRQPRHGDVQLIVDHGTEHREVSAASVWHLLLAEPALCDKELLPMLETLRPGWHLRDMANRLEAELFNVALNGPPVPRAHVLELVEELAAPQYARRQNADRQIREFGPAALAILDSVDAGSLNREQRQRIQDIRDSMSGAGIDSPQRAALWLANDEKAWLALLKHTDPQRRHLAAIRLMTMRPDPIDFDPYADEPSRQAQLAQLRLQIGY